MAIGIEHERDPVARVAVGRGRLARVWPLARATVPGRGGFWSRRQRINREASLAHGYAQLEQAGNLSMLAAAAAGERRELDIVRFPPYLDTDVYKWLEAVAWSAPHGLPSGVAAGAERAIDLISRAQAPDGYLNSFYQVAFPELRWTDVGYSHEIYSAGHLIQAAVAWSRSLGDRRLLDVAIRFADLIEDTFGPGRRPEPDGHPLAESALVELYRETGERRYLALASFFLDQRGQGLLGDNQGRWYFGGRAYFQDHVPVREATTLEGHAVRALYLVTGAVDVYLEDGDQALLRASERQWRDLVTAKLYITGSTGQRPETEGFGERFELAPGSGYCESCAAIASFGWNWRLLLATGKARYAELMERTLYNGVLPGISEDGRRFFYRNTLSSDGSHRRAAWHYVACCPPNLMRLVASVAHYAASQDAQGVQIQQYLDAELEAGRRAGPIRLRMRSEAPWGATTTVTVLDTPPDAWTLSARIPEWASGATLSVVGGRSRAARAGSYARVRRRWRRGDRVHIELPLSPRFVEVDPRVEAMRGQVALQRGPLLYCWEACDQPSGVDLATASVDIQAKVETDHRSGRFGEAVWLNTPGSAMTEPDGADLYRDARTAPLPEGRPVGLVAAPYAMWANRRRGRMRVWMPRTPGQQPT
jgi:DUF1680 family protein